MPQTKGQTSQDVNDAALSNLGTQGRDAVSSLFGLINTSLNAPLRMAATQPTADANLNFMASSVIQADGASLSAPALKSQVFSLAASTINFQTQATTGATFIVAWPTSTLNYYRRVGFTLLSSGSIQMLWSPEVASSGSLANAGTLFVKSGLALGWIDLKCTNTLGYFKTAQSATSIIENADLHRFGAGSGSGSSSASGSSGGELADLMYSGKVLDLFSDLPDGTTTVDIAAGKTSTLLYDSSNNLFRLAYDASKTVTGTGVNMTLSATPAYTVAIGDMLIYNGEARRVITVTSQTVYVLDYAFAANPTAGACCVSQAVHTVDLNNFTNNGNLQSVASQYSGNVDELMMGYWDSTSVGAIVPTFGTAPVVAYSASTDAASWTVVKSRVTSLSSQEQAVTCNTSNPNLYLRFFSNATSGSGAVNLLRYKVSFQKVFGQTVGGTYYTAFARPTAGLVNNCTHSVVGGKSRFTFTWSYTRGLNPTEPSGSILEAIGNGQIIPRYIAGLTDTTQAYFNEINDNTIELDTDYSLSGFDFQFKVQRVGIIDTNTQNLSRIAYHDDLLDQSLDAQITIPQWLTAVNRTPTSSQFRSDITGRASIPDLSSMLSVQMGPQRMMTQEIYQIQNEFGPAGQPVYGVVNDKFNQVRFVGGWISFNNNGGQGISTVNFTDYIEVIFYGTGLNLITTDGGASKTWNVSVDGGSNVAMSLSSTGWSAVTGSRNYSNNVLLNAASGLSLGLHTIKIINTAGTGLFSTGLEVLTETTSLRVMPGTVAKGKYKNILSSMQTVAYDSVFESGTLGTRGGCVLVYLKNDGTIGKAVTPTDSAAGYLTGASHANEEIVRTYHWREFGAGRTDDFSLLTTTLSNLSFTLDDGVTTLVGYQVRKDTSSTDESLAPNATGAYITLTFIGTGLSVVLGGGVGTPSDTFQVWVDGVNQGNMPQVINQTAQICSGLLYGTHTVKILRTVVSVGIITIKQFNIYAPKKSSLPIGSVELVQYYKMASYVAASNAAINFIGSGVIRKITAQREAIYTGTWGLSVDAGSGFENAWNMTTTTSGATISYSFFGTGFDFRPWNYISAYNSTMTIDGLALNAGKNIGSSVNFLQTSSGLSFSAAGVLTGTSAGTGKLSMQVSGLALGWHKMTWTTNNTSQNYADVLDIICPIHAPAINGPYVVQNTLSLGNNGFLDLRKFNKRDIIQANLGKIVKTSGIQAASTSATSAVPCTDLSCTIKTFGGHLDISYFVNAYSSTSGNYLYTYVYVDGTLIPSTSIDQVYSTSSAGITLSNRHIIPVSPGIHKVDIYWNTNTGTLTSNSANSRQLTVQETNLNN